MTNRLQPGTMTRMRRQNRRRSSLIALAAVAAAGIGVLGCGGNENSSTADGGSSPDGSARAQFAAARSCLQDGEHRVLGAPSGPGDTNAPAFELIVGYPAEEGAFLALYGTADEANRLLPEVQDNATRSNDEGASVSVEPHGSVTVVWAPTPPTDEFRDAVIGCLP